MKEMVYQQKQDQYHLQSLPTAHALPLRPGVSDNETMTPPAVTPVPPGLVSPGISVEFHGEPEQRPALIHPR
jgi:[calcium/calmodulin-dependent protein kinase] kinase